MVGDEFPEAYMKAIARRLGRLASALASQADRAAYLRAWEIGNILYERGVAAQRRREGRSPIPRRFRSRADLSECG